MNELIPDWLEKEPPPLTPVTSDRMLFLTEKHALPLPIPPQMHNDGNYVISLSQMVRWLGSRAEELGVEVEKSLIIVLVPRPHM